MYIGTILHAYNQFVYDLVSLVYYSNSSKHNICITVLLISWLHACSVIKISTVVLILLKPFTEHSEDKCHISMMGESINYIPIEVFIFIWGVFYIKERMKEY